MSPTPASALADPAHALVASADEWWARALESVLEPAGYRVARAATGADVLTLARRSQPDVVIVHVPLPDIDALEVCRALRQQGAIGRAVPIIGIASDPITHAQRLNWLEAGAWDFFGVTVEREELLARLQNYLGAKREADHAQTATLIDAETGLYNGRGVERRARELAAAAVRGHAPLACVVFGAVMGAEPRGGAAAAASPASSLRRRLAPLLRAHGRLSDTIGWWNDGEFAVLAPGTDPSGAALLAQRLATAIEAAPPEPETTTPAFALKVGYEAVADLHATPVGADVLLARATSALASARRAGPEARIQRFQVQP